MLFLKTEKLELRGVLNQNSKTSGNPYYILNCETAEGTPLQFYGKDYSLLPDGMKKGDNVVLTLGVTNYKGKKDFVISKVEHIK